MNNLLRSEEVEQVFPPSLHSEQSRLAIGPCDSLGLEPPLRRGEAQWIAAEVLLMVARRAVYGVSFRHFNVRSGNPDESGCSPPLGAERAASDGETVTG